MTSASIARPEPGEYSDAVKGYVQLVPATDARGELDRQIAELRGLLGSLTNEQALQHHAPYTWSIKQVVGHMNDCERIFGYRALRLARNDTTPLPSFDDHAYMQAIDFDALPLGDLLTEFELLRRSHLLLFKQLNDGDWLRQGVVNHHAMTVRAVAYVMAGHARHHLDILRKRLGK